MSSTGNFTQNAKRQKNAILAWPNSTDQDQMPKNTTSEQDLHYLSFIQ